METNAFTTSFKDCSYHGSEFDESLFAQICLPSCSDMTIEEQDKIIGLISDLL